MRLLEQERLPPLARAVLHGRNIRELVRRVIGEAGLDFLCLYAGDLARKAVDFAVEVHDDIEAFVAARQKVAAGLKGLDEGVSVRVFLRGLCDLLHALFLGRAGAFFLLLLGEVLDLGMVGEAILAPVVLHAGGKGEVVIAGVFLGNGARLLPVMRELDGLHLFGIDA